MARRPRIHFAGAFYHVIAWGDRGQKVFANSKITGSICSFWRNIKITLGTAHFKRNPAVINKGVKEVEKKLTEDRQFTKSVAVMIKALIRNKKRKIVNQLSLTSFLHLLAGHAKHTFQEGWLYGRF
jgi:hypothetical protein